MLSFRRLALAACLLPFSQSASALNLPNQLEFEGYFSEVVSSGEGCDGIFSAENYKVQHFRMGPTRRTSVMHLTGLGVDPAQSFFHRVSFYGNLGGSSDLYYRKDFERGDVMYQIVADGIIDARFVLLEFDVVGRGADGTEQCEVSATFAAFN